MTSQFFKQIIYIINKYHSQQLVKEYQYEIIFALLDLSQEEIRKNVEKAQIYKKIKLSLPCIYLFDTRFEPAIRYKFEREFELQEIKNFIDDWKKNQVLPFLKTAAIPDNQDGPVKVIVGSNFRSEVYESQESVLVEFYAPWCHHCKQFAPIYDEIAKIFEGNKHLIIAKIDSTENESEGIEINSYPTIYLVKKLKQEQANYQIIEYKGDRKFDSVIEFLKKHVSVAFPEEIMNNNTYINE